MSTNRSRFGESLRIVWAIMAKDITDAIKNRTTLVAILSTLFVVIIYRYLPVLESGDELPNVLVYDAGNSSLGAALEDSLQLKVYYQYPSQERMERDLVNGDVPELGLVIPPDFDRALEGGSLPELQGYVMHWVSQSDASELESLVEREISDLGGQPVSINLEGNTIYTRPDSLGYPFLTSVALVLVATVIGLTMVPHLMIDEKQNKTLDALLLSPASVTQITLGKALTGLFYTLISMGMVFAINYSLVTNWALAFVVSICGSALGVALGLLLGSVFDTRQQITLWTWVVIAPLLLPVFLSAMTDLLPAGVVSVIHWIPTVALTRAFRLSFSDTAPLGQFGPELALVLGCAVPVGAVVAWIVRRSDR
jgi:ABC-2 type transport system permease protein